LEGPIIFFHFEHYLPLAQVCDRVGQVFQPTIKAQLNVEWQLLDADQRRQLALSVLKQIPCLLLWDNFEPVAGFPAGTPSDWKPEEQQELRDFLRDLRGGQTKVLLTSRRDEPWLGKIYRLVELSGLKRAEAQELAVKVLERAGMNGAQIKALPQYNDLLDSLRGNPLAIQIILPELKHTKPDALLQSLQAGTTKLSTEDSTQGREHSLSASLTYRLDRLDPIMHKRLGLLGLFQGFADADILSAICKIEDTPELIHGLAAEEWIAMLDKAAEVGLVRSVGTGLYTVHPALPWFFNDLLQEAFPDTHTWLERSLSNVYGQYGLFLSQLFKTNTQLAMNLLTAEESNFNFALRLARKHKLWDVMVGMLDGLDRLLTTQGRWVEWKRLIAELEIDVTDTTGEPLPDCEDLWRAILGHRSQIAGYFRDFNTQQALTLRLKDHFEKIKNECNVAVALHQLGRIAEEQGNRQEAIRFYQQAAAMFARLNDPHNLGIAQRSLQRVQTSNAERDAS
jgi:hypothetical protein